MSRRLDPRKCRRFDSELREVRVWLICGLVGAIADITRKIRARIAANLCDTRHLFRGFIYCKQVRAWSVVVGVSGELEL